MVWILKEKFQWYHDLYGWTANCEWMRTLKKIFWDADRKMPRSKMGKMLFSCFRPIFGPISKNSIYFRPTFGPIWINFTCFRQKKIQIGPKVGLKQENCIFLFWTSAFSCRCLKNFFWVYTWSIKRSINNSNISD